MMNHLDVLMHTIYKTFFSSEFSLVLCERTDICGKPFRCDAYGNILQKRGVLEPAF